MSCFGRGGRGGVRRIWDTIMNTVDSREDIDRMLSYNTRMQVKFLDRKLGITFYLINLCILGYIVGYMFIYKKGYLELEQAKGGVVTHVYGDGFSVSSGKPAERYFSSEELTYPNLENGNVFIMTRLKVEKQTRGVCEDPDMPCVSDADCHSWASGKCSANGFCEEQSWCSEQGKPEIYEIDTGKLTIWTRSSIQFVKIAPERVYSTEAEDPLPKKDHNAFTVSDLLMKCEPLPVRYEEVAELGAVVEITFLWECGVKEKTCTPTIKARRMDTVFDPEHIGYGFSYPEYVDGTTRYKNSARGVRFFFRTVGIGKKLSVSATVNKASLGASLFTMATVVADLLMVKAFTLSKKYKARKFETTPDFSEYMKQKKELSSSQVTVDTMDVNEKKIQEQEDDWLQRLDELDT